MQIRTGIDIVHLKRFEKTMMSNNSILLKIFHPSEIRLGSSHSLAGIYAVKEAVFKAFDMKKKNWHDIEVGYQESGKPQFRLLIDEMPKIISIDTSISHEGDYLVGMVTILLDTKDLKKDSY